MSPDLASVLLSGVIGLSLGIFGGGGSILAVPVLVLVTHLAPAGAVGTSLAMVGTTSLVGSYAHHRRGLVRPKVGLLFGLSGVLTAFLGAKLTGLVSGAVLMHTFTALMLVVGIGMLFGKDRIAGAGGQARRASPRPTAALLAGAGVGLVTGFLGVGGGFLVVPALVAFAGLDMREAVGTSLLVIAINSAAGFVGHLGGDRLDLGLTAGLAAPAVAGALLGERLARHISTLKLRRGFGLIVVAAAVALGFGRSVQNRDVGVRGARARAAATANPPLVTEADGRPPTTTSRMRRIIQCGDWRREVRLVACPARACLRSERTRQGARAV